MRIIASFIFLLSSIVSFGQSKCPSKTEVLKVINLTIAQKPHPPNNNSCEYGLCGEWWIGNKDSSFYKSDTLKLFNSSNLSFANHDCTFKVWTFNNENKFSQTDANMCEEPPTMTVGNIYDSIQKLQPNRFEVVEDWNFCFINTYVDGKIHNSYKVTDLAKAGNPNFGNSSFVLTIVRNRN